MTTKAERLAFEPTPGGPKCCKCGKKSYFASRGVFYCHATSACTPPEARKPVTVIVQAGLLNGR